MVWRAVGLQQPGPGQLLACLQTLTRLRDSLHVKHLTCASSEKPQRPSTPPHAPSPAGPRALQLSPLGEPPRRQENPARPPLSAAGRVPSHRGGGRPAGRADGERPGAVWLGNAVTAPAPDPGPSEAPARASCQSAGRARPRPRPRLRRRGAAREWRHVTGRCSCRRLALRRVSAHVPRLSGLGVAPRREASSYGPGSTLGDIPLMELLIAGKVAY
ncbi:uncharacterized protein LOC132352980 [Balaenoptera ricei]|uniref:uncharacterized protein LOC132352980 n=1 Tax=Balaenoptera ricei TaxID=2746895 RepID=UPI0028BDF594|nr:uncharacterized protein LOC132352980 [Balaenoptera ricei]